MNNRITSELIVNISNLSYHSFIIYSSYIFTIFSVTDFKLQTSHFDCIYLYRV